jgi:Flp pilus assembly protein TadD
LGNCTDNSFTAGNIGFEVATAEMGMVHASFDNLSVWAISSEAASPGQTQVDSGAALGHSNYDDHTKDLREPIDLSQSDASAWYNRSVTLQELGQTAEAQAAFAKARELGYKG